MRTSLLIAALFFSNICIAQPTEDMRASLYVDDPTGLVLIDGNLVNYGSQYSSNIDIYDAWKLANPGMNFGMRRQNMDFVIERRSLITDRDTIFYRLWNMALTNFKIKFEAKDLNHPGMTATLHDAYLNTDTDIALQGMTFTSFSITSDPASRNEYRFTLTYKLVASSPLSVNITGIRASRLNKGIQVYWDVEDESNIDYYMAERSADGVVFKDLVKIDPMVGNFNKTYTFIDIYAESAIQFYKIRAVSKDGKIQYSTVAKVSAAELGSTNINVYPNPVINKVVQVKFNNLPIGKYTVSLASVTGSSQQLGYLVANSSNMNSSVSLPKTLVPGTYFLKFTSPEGSGITKQIQVL